MELDFSSSNQLILQGKKIEGKSLFLMDSTSSRASAVGIILYKQYPE